MPGALAILALLAFEAATVHFEQNVTDGDVEVVFAAKGGGEGLRSLRVTAPDGRTVVDFRAPDASTLGIRQFDFESPEPADVGLLKTAYPEGSYRFRGETASGQVLSGESVLSHELPDPAPQVGISGLEISWTPVAGVAGYVVEIENDELEVGLEARLPASAAAFRVPEGFLEPQTEYELQIGTLSSRGNVSFVETSFTTDPEP